MTRAIPSLFRLWFGFSTRVDRSSYIRWGVVLMIVKYLLDATVAWAVTGHWWSPWRYLVPIWAVRMAQFPHPPGLLLLWLGLITLPFFWIGVSMSVRRAADAGQPPVLGLGFAIPGLNWLVMLFLVLAGTSPLQTWTATRAADDDLLPGLRSALTAIAAATLIGIGMTLVAARGWGLYGFTLFFGTPLAMGVITGYLMNRRRHTSLTATVGAAVLATVLTAGGLLLFALEGLICIAMVAPIALAIVVVGALVGRAMAIYDQDALSSTLVVLLSLPLLGMSERAAVQPALHEVLSTIDIDAPPEVVWEHVIGFSELPSPEDWVFRTGIAYPVRARIHGSGVGAVRSCEFSTGPFIEPITDWEPGRRLAFDVRSQPPSMQEWSAYASLHPPHLDSLLRSRRGEFRLTRRPDGGTHLEGRTWYELTAAPTIYWRVWSDAIIHRIHQRVLAHVRRLSEAD